MTSVLITDGGGGIGPLTGQSFVRAGNCAGAGISDPDRGASEPGGIATRGKGPQSPAYPHRKSNAVLFPDSLRHAASPTRAADEIVEFVSGKATGLRRLFEADFGQDARPRS